LQCDDDICTLGIYTYTSWAPPPPSKLAYSRPGISIPCILYPVVVIYKSSIDVRISCGRISLRYCIHLLQTTTSALTVVKSAVITAAMNISYDDAYTEWADLHPPARIEQCPYPFCSHGASTLHQACSHHHISESFPATRHYGPWGPVGLIRSFVPENSPSIGPLCRSGYGYLSRPLFRSARASFPYSEHSFCQCEVLQHSTRPAMRQEYLSGGVELPRATTSSNLAFSELDHLSSRIPTNISLFESDRSPSHKTPPTVPPINLHMDDYSPSQIAAVGLTASSAETESICTTAVSSLLKGPAMLTEPAREEVRATSRYDVFTPLHSTIDQCNWNASPTDLFFSEINDSLDCTGVSQQLYDSLNENHLIPIASDAVFDGRKYENAEDYPTLCSDELEAFNLVEAPVELDANLAEVSGDLGAEPPVSPYLSIESSNVSTGMMSDDPLLTSPSTSTIPLLDEPSDEPLTPTPRPTSFASSTGMLTTSPVLELPTPAESVTSFAFEAVRTSEIGEESPVRALGCPFQGCTSKVLFTRTCDLNKHYRQHFKRFFCRIEGCSMSEQPTHSGRTYRSSMGFATKKDRLRHETSHDPSIICEICKKVFSRADNMHNHMKRIHRRYFIG